MLKLAVCIGVIVAGACGGIAVSARYRARVRQLEQCDALLVRICASLAAERVSTAELVARLDESGSFPDLLFLHYAAERLRSSVVFPEIWRSAVEESRGRLGLTAVDYPPLLELGGIVGACEVREQLERIALLRETLRQNTTEAVQEYQTNGKLARSLGLFCGIAAAILIA